MYARNPGRGRMRVVPGEPPEEHADGVHTVGTDREVPMRDSRTRSCKPFPCSQRRPSSRALVLGVVTRVEGGLTGARLENAYNDTSFRKAYMQLPACIDENAMSVH